MKLVSSFSILALAAIAVSSVPGYSESKADHPSPDIISEISASSEGEITVEVSPELLQKILYNQETVRKNSVPAQRGGYGRTSGYRIQVFSDGRNQHSLEARAKARGNAIIARFPKYRGQVYTQSASPNWYTRIGNFQTAAEASHALEELKRAFPQYSSEMRVVKSKIIVSQ